MSIILYFIKKILYVKNLEDVKFDHKKRKILNKLKNNNFSWTYQTEELTGHTTTPRSAKSEECRVTAEIYFLGAEEAEVTNF